MILTERGIYSASCYFNNANSGINSALRIYNH